MSDIVYVFLFFFFFKQKTAYEMRISDWSSDVCSSDLQLVFENKGETGAVYHVYDLHDLDAIPRRYTVEAGSSLDDEWNLAGDGSYDLEVFGPNGDRKSVV